MARRRSSVALAPRPQLPSSSRARHARVSQAPHAPPGEPQQFPQVNTKKRPPLRATWRTAAFPQVTTKKRQQTPHRPPSQSRKKLNELSSKLVLRRATNNSLVVLEWSGSSCREQMS